MSKTKQDVEMTVKSGDLNENDNSDQIKHASDIIGSFGPFQRNILIFLVILYFVAPFQNAGIVFYTPTLNFTCHRPPGYEVSFAIMQI